MIRLALLLVSVALLPASSPTAQVISQGSGAERRVALTFDAGADRGYAARILTILEKRHVAASFGMTGRWAENNRDLVRRMARDGDVLMNHTYDHRSFTGYSSGLAPLTPAQRRWEINRTERIVHSLTGHSTKPFFRPPYGDYDASTLSLVRTLGYRYMVMWTIDTLGWNHLPSAGILQRCSALLKPGAVIVMHVGAQSQDALALDPLIRLLKQRHYRMVTIAQLIKSG